MKPKLVVILRFDFCPKERKEDLKRSLEDLYAEEEV